MTRIALIQGSIDSQLKADPHRRALVFKQYFGLSQNALREYGRLDLIVWPETMFRDSMITFDEDAAVPDDLGWSEEEYHRRLGELARYGRWRMAQLAGELKTPLLVGVDRFHYGSGGDKCYNSAAFVAARGELLGCYDKMHLVLFGEYVPFAQYVPWLQRLTPLPVSLSAGERPVAFQLERLRVAPNICYESVLPHAIRRQVNTLRSAGREPDVLVNLTNDGWFWGSSELDMHLVCGVFRAVECRKPFLIAANTGFSAWIDADGRIIQQGPRRAVGTILAEVRPDRRTSWYLAHGDWPAGICLAACLFLAAVGCWDRLRKKRAARVSEPIDNA